MKKLLFIVLFIVIGLNITKAQTNKYYPIPDTNAFWRVNSATGGSCPSSPPLLMDVEHYQYTLDSDTAIGSNNYKKVYKSGKDSSNWCPNSWHVTYFYYYVGALRQDSLNKKVYFKWNSYPERLIYDFSKQVGDTLSLFKLGSMSYTVTITSIDSVLVGSNYHKRFNVSTGVCSGTTLFAMIEGVGSTAGLLDGIPAPPYMCSGTWASLQCFSHYADIYPNGSSCSLMPNIGIDQIKDVSSKINMYPNPSSNSITIQSAIELGTVNIYNSLGKVVLQTKSKNMQEQIDVSKLAAGIYTVLAQGKYMKLVKE